jgi:UDP-N-acetylmuramoyl-L-alanyl-D-glutamate--2,6-diaminopimelate ligase
VAAALAALDQLGIDRRDAVPAISAYAGVPGRFERIDEGQQFEVIVDFAHTPDALEQLLATVRAAIAPSARLIIVFGIARVTIGLEELGAVARRRADQLILTTSGFRGTPRIGALAATLPGVRASAGADFTIILDRRRAFQHAVVTARAGDAVVIPGRGAYTTMQPDPRGRPIPFDDRAVMRDVLRGAVSRRRLSDYS